MPTGPSPNKESPKEPGRILPELPQGSTQTRRCEKSGCGTSAERAKIRQAEVCVRN